MPQPATSIRLLVTNNSARAITVSLEPLGYFHDLQPHESRHVIHRLDAEPRLEIGVDDTGHSIWDETDAVGDRLLFEGEQHHHGAS